MTVSTELSHEEYTGNGVTTDFDFRFRIFEAKHLVVSVADQDGTERILTNGTDYTLRGVGSYRGGKVILKMPLATGWKIGIARDLPVVQETDLRNQGKFFAEVHEDAFDYLTMLIQKSLGFLSLCLRKPSFISDHYDAKGNKISNLGKPVKDGDAVDLGTMKGHISAKDKRSLRVADKDILALPGTSVRRNKQLGFDNNGMPLLLDPAETGALGYVLVDSFEKGAVITSRYQALHWLHNGEYYRWDGALPKTVPAGSMPDSAGGVGMGAWVSIGDASLRRDIEGVLSARSDTVHERISGIYDDRELVISTWNIWGFQSIAGRYRGKIRDSRRFYDLMKFSVESGSHVVCMQECYSGPYADMSNLAAGPYTSGFFGKGEISEANTTFGYGYGVFSLSKYELASGITKAFADEGDYKRIVSRNVITHPLYGKVAVYNLHSGWFEKVNTNIYEFIISDYNSLGISRVIVAGDFNHENTDWFSPLLSNGFIAANNKNHNTKNSDDGSEWFIDNIFVIGMTIKSVSVYTPYTDLSDHKMLTVKLGG